MNDATCQEFVELVTDYLEGALGSAERDRVERHLDACRGCVNYLEHFCVTIRLIGTLREDDPAAASRETLLEQFRGETPPRSDTHASFGRRRLAGRTAEEERAGETA